MKFTKWRKPLLMGALSVGLVFGISSCLIQDYATGYLYVTGTVTTQPSGNGIITGFWVEHNTGYLWPIDQTPLSSGGANPVRAVLSTGSTFLYVLNRGTTASGGSNCTTADPCQGANITQFTVGGNGILTPQQTFYSQGINPFRLIEDSSGSYLFVLDHDAPSNAYCSVVGTATCGDITVFEIDPTTGRLSLVSNSQVSSANGTELTYFPVPGNPVDFVMASNSLLTLSSATAQSTYPYTGGSMVFPYSFLATSGQLTISSNSIQPLGIGAGTAIQSAGGYVYVLDNEPVTVTFNGSSTTSQSQILPYTVGSNGALQAAPSGVVPDDPTLANPIAMMVESKGKFIYVANQGNNVQGQNAASGVAGYFLTTTPAYQLSYIAGEPFGSGSGPQCIVEDPSDQFIYTANYNDSSVTGHVVDPNAGVFYDMRVTSTFSLKGPATWCLINSRTN